ncbi:hypothetical protein PENTCL1PPCAC_396 [Pristionchus entomophagus]|uniref:Protein kinase domain-containing protein n=1 Tax=Pristionchus entomophagus TaxID=358040 RepID=A0AAV5S688_9BILA|nr:hypothetical protein PENTCL1PPCAC_396 [Pristionchus entomophagus]
MFLREVDVLLRFNHTGIVRFFDAWKDDCAFLYIQMELCQSTLSEWLSANSLRDPSRMIHWFKQIVSAVLYIHEHARIYRDLKPSNILFKNEDHLKVSDLGIVSDRTVMKDDMGQEVITELTLGKGTEMYMAPEQMGWEDYTTKVDIFALGLIFTELSIAMTSDQAKKQPESQEVVHISL